jgi:hypothetical protein
VCEDLLAKWQPRVYYAAIPGTSFGGFRNNSVAQGRYIHCLQD